VRFGAGRCEGPKLPVLSCRRAAVCDTFGVFQFTALLQMLPRCTSQEIRATQRHGARLFDMRSETPLRSLVRTC